MEQTVRKSSRISCLFMMMLMSFSLGQAQEFRHDSLAFGPNEQLTYTVTFNWGIIWLDVGQVDFQVKPSTTAGKQSFHFLSTGHSFKAYDWFFKVRDTFETVSIADLKPLKYRRHTQEGNFFMNNSSVFDYNKMTVSSNLEDSQTPINMKINRFAPGTLDVLTTTYALRSMPFHKLSQGDTLSPIVFLDGRTIRLPIVYKGKESITGTDQKPHQCHKFEAILEKSNTFRSGEAISVWVADEPHHMPLLIEAKIMVGNIKVQLVKHNYLTE
ncbi:MAG: DUF3108 domain-containing protein [Bacteroidales bacterium]|nr:DUF3108 domain-containing protein [Bacteroidales bacterium]